MASLTTVTGQERHDRTVDEALTAIERNNPIVVVELHYVPPDEESRSPYSAADLERGAELSIRIQSQRFTRQLRDLVSAIRLSKLGPYHEPLDLRYGCTIKAGEDTLLTLYFNYTGTEVVLQGRPFALKGPLLQWAHSNIVEVSERVLARRSK